MNLLTCLPLILALHITCSAQKQGVDLDITAADGAKLRASYYAGDSPGPGILLLHQCNMDRKSWHNLAIALTERGSTS